MSSNPLEPLTQAAKGVVQNTVAWAFGGKVYKGSYQGGKTDPVFRNYPLDVLRRAAYHNVFDTLCAQMDEYPYVVPDRTLKKIVGVFKNNIFPTGTMVTIEDDTVNELLQSVVAQTNFRLKAEKIIEESALMGYCGLRSVFDEASQKWLLEVKQKEYLVIEHADGNPEDITAIGMEWPIARKEILSNGKTRVRTFWRKERWTNELFQQWPEQIEKVGQKPVFKPEDATEEPNVYGEIPYTIVPHIYDDILHGVGVVDSEEVMTVKALIRLYHKRHYGHQKYMDPNPVIKNRTNPGEPIDLSIGKVVDVQQADPNLPVDMALLEFAGMPESVKDEIYDHVCSLYYAAGLTPPNREEAFKPGVNAAGVAMRLQGKDDAELMETLRDNGYSQVFRHLEKILRMGKALGRSEYSIVNPDDPEKYKVTGKFPDFFPPTDDEIAMKLSNMRQAKLPASIRARMIASLFGIEDEDEIKQIEQGIIEDQEMEKAAMMPPIMGE